MDTIEERANRAFPDEYPFFPGSDTGTSRAKERRGYIKACKDYESLPKIHGWVARDEDGRLCMYGDKPLRDIFYGNKAWFVERDLWELPKDIFPEITWESEPVEVELLIRKV